MPSITNRAWVPKEAPHSFQSTPNDGGRRRNHTETKGVDTHTRRISRISDRVENVGARSPLEKRISRIARMTSQVATGAAKKWVSESSIPTNNSLKRQISRPWDLPSLNSPGTYIASKTRSTSTTTNQRRSQTTAGNNVYNSSSPPSLSNKSDSTDSIANKTAHQCVAHASKRQAAAKAAMNATSHISNILRDLMGDSNRALAVARQSQVEAEEAAARAAGAAKKVKEVSDLAAKDIERANLELEEAHAQAEEAREFLKRVQSISSSGSRRMDENDYTIRNNAHRTIPERVRISIDANEERHLTTRHSSAIKYPQSPRKTYGAPLSPTGVKKQKSDNNWWNDSVREQHNVLRAPPPSAALASTTNLNSSFIEPIRSFKGHTSPVTQVVAVDKCRFLSSSWDTTIRLWDADTGECTRTYCGHDDWVTAIQVLDSKHFISGSDDRCVKLWRFDAEVCLRTFTGHTSFVKSLAPIDSDRFLSGSRDRTIKLFSVSSGDCCQTYQGHTDVISAIAHMGSNRFASGSHDRQVKVWNISSTSSCEQTLVGHGGVIKALAAVSERELLSGSDDKTIRLWNIIDGICIREFGSTKNALVFSVIHVCEGFFLSCGGNNIKVYNIRTGKCVKSYETPRVSLAVARLGNERFVTGSDHQLHLRKF